MYVLYFVIKIYPAMRAADEKRVFVVHQASEMDTREQRSVRRPADISHTIFRQRPQEHDERTVIVVIHCLITCNYLQLTFPIRKLKELGQNTFCKWNKCILLPSAVFTAQKLWTRLWNKYFKWKNTTGRNKAKKNIFTFSIWTRD